MAQQSDSPRAQVYRQLEPSAWRARGLSPVNRIIVALILGSTAIAVIETEPHLYHPFASWFAAAELLFGALFLVEYLARLWAVAEDRSGTTAWRRRLRFVLSPAALLDLAVVVVSLAPALGQNAAMLRLVRLIRIARLAKLGRLSVALGRLSLAVWLRRFELGLTIALALCVLLFGATALYWLEGELQPDKFGTIPRAMWWAVITLTTIGYGDVYPLTAAGKVAASLLAFSGIGLIALPAGIMANAMHEAVRTAEPDRQEEEEAPVAAASANRS